MRADRILLVAALLGAVAAPAPARADSVSLTWTAPGDDGTSGTASAYEIRYSESPVAGVDTVSWWASARTVGSLPSPRRAGTRESFVVAGLAPATTYYFGIRTSDEVPNVSGYSNIVRKQTGSAPVTLATPGGFHADPKPGAVLLAWNAVPAGGTEVGYRLYRKAAPAPAPSLLATLPVTAASWSDSTTAAGTMYDFSIVTYGDGGESDPAVVQVTTPGAAAAAATAPEVVHGYPNPARDQVTFRHQVDTPSSTAHTRVTIFDLTGHKICMLADQEFAPGEHSLSWLCRSDQGNRVAPGIYNVIVEGPQGRAVTRVAIVP